VARRGPIRIRTVTEAARVRHHGPPGHPRDLERNTHGTQVSGCRLTVGCRTLFLSIGPSGLASGVVLWMLNAIVDEALAKKPFDRIGD
jgi:hypothetical protein